MSEHAPRTASEKKKKRERNALYFRQRCVALERLGDCARTLGAKVGIAETVHAFEEPVSTRRAQPARRKRRREKRNAPELRQRRVALERCGNGARTLGADIVAVEAVCAFAGRREEREKNE